MRFEPKGKKAKIAKSISKENEVMMVLVLLEKTRLFKIMQEKDFAH